MGKQKLSDLVANQTQKKQPATAEPSRSVGIPAVDAVRGSNTAIQKTMKYKEIDPIRCRPWAHHNRPDVWLTENSCASLIESIRSDGQLELGLVRAVFDEPGIDYEIIYGVRRWFAVSQIPGAKFKAKITDSDDRECALLMHVENEESEDISEFEKALSYEELVRSKVFSSQASLAESLRVSRPYISKLMRASKLFSYAEIRELLKPFTRELSVQKALEIVLLLDDTRTERKVVSRALELGSEEGGSLSMILTELKTSATAKPKSSSKERCHFKHGNKKLLHSVLKSNGKFVLTMEPDFLNRAGDNADDLLRSALSDVVAMKRKS